MSTIVRGILAKKGTQVYAVGADEDVYTALEHMARHDVGTLVVLDGDEPVGVMSERDYARKVILLGRSSRGTRVRDVMGSPVLTAALDDSVATCMARMTERRVRHLPVLDEGRLVGLVSIGDLVKALIDEQAFEIEQMQGFIAGTR
jgi:CBS domain-containing protein